MTRFYPDEYLKKVMPGGIEKNGLLYDNLSIKQRYAKALYKAAGREGKALKQTISETVAYYAKREEGAADQALLTQRIENFLVWNKVQEEKAAHKGQWYRWLPSDAKNPDPDHQLLYGEIRREGDGEMPGERYGCRCGIEWLSIDDMVKEGKADLLTPEYKSSSLEIDFNKTNILPPLNKEDLAVLGFENKRPALMKRTITRNLKKHGDLKDKDYNTGLGRSLYLHPYPIFKDLKQKTYWHFVGAPIENRKSFFDVILEANDKKKRLEIVHFHKREKRQMAKFLRKYGIET